MTIDILENNTERFYLKVRNMVKYAFPGKEDQFFYNFKPLPINFDYGK